MGEILLRRTTVAALVLLVAVIGGQHYHRVQWSIAVHANEAAHERHRAAQRSEENINLRIGLQQLSERHKRLRARPRFHREMLDALRLAAVESKRLANEQAQRQRAINPT